MRSTPDIPTPNIHRKACALLTALLLACLCGTAVAAESLLAGAPDQKKKPLDHAASALGFGAGVLAAYGIHEAGHWAAAAVTGTELQWESGTYNQPLGFTEDADSDTNGAVLHGSGLVAQAVCGEVILAVDSIDKTHPVVWGMMFWNVANPVIYAIDYWFLHSSNQVNADGYQGDLAGIEHYAGKTTANTFAAASATLAIWQGYRFWKAQDKTPAPDADPLQLSVAPVPEGGAMFSIQFQF